MTSIRFKTPPARRGQRGITVVVVLVLLSVMLLGAMSLARMSEVGTLAAGNLASKEAALLASETGVTTAFNALKTLADIQNNAGTWYFAKRQNTDANGVPQVSFDAAPEVKVDNRYSVRYVVERLCEVNDVTEPMRQCLVKRGFVNRRVKAGAEELDPNAGIQYRVTVRVTDLRGTSTMVQSLVTKSL